MVNVYSFDVDETLEISNGPIPLKALMDLRIEGHIVGICGNWGLLVQMVPGWQHLVSFVNCCLTVQTVDGHIMGGKDWFLSQLKRYVPADDYIHVGNVLGVSGGSDDKGSAERAGWRFIKESDFAAGAR